MERFSQFRDRGEFDVSSKRAMLITDRLWDRTFPPHTHGACGLLSAFPCLSIHDSGAPAPDCRSGLLSDSTMVADRCLGKESSIVDNSGSAWDMVDGSTN